MKPPAPWLVGHRGAMAYAPENTRASFEKAWRLGVDAVECDVHLSQDGVPVVLHDATLDRTTSGRGTVRGKKWRELRRLDAGAWFGPSFRGEPLWRLQDLLAWAKFKKGRSGAPLGLLIEIKKSSTPRAVAEAVVRAVRARGFLRRVLVISFDGAALRAVKTLCPALPTGFLLSTLAAGWDGTVSRLGADGVFPRYTFIGPALVARVKKRGWFLGTWTVNQSADMRRLARWGVDAIASNVPDRLARAVHSIGSPRLSRKSGLLKENLFLPRSLSNRP